MSPLLDLIILSLAMGGGTFFFGLLPLGLRLSRLTLRILEVGGAGLLLGAAASVVMPEGAGALFRSQPNGGGGGHKHEGDDGHDHAAGNQRRGIADVDPETLLAMSFLAGMLVLFIIDQLMAPGPHIHAPPSHNHDEPEPDREAGMHIDHSGGSRHVDRPHLDRHLSRMSRPESMILTRSNAIPTLSSLGKKSKLSSGGGSVNAGSSGSKNGKSRNDSPSSGSDGSVTGLPADYYTTTTQDHVESAYRKQNAHAHARQSSTPSSPLLGATRSPPASPPRRRDRESRHEEHDHDDAASISSARGLRAAFTSIAGLLIHAACDGIAMGASAASHDEGLKLVVVGAILLHKAPAAFGLCTLLISRGMSRADIRKAMAIFSLATPAGALGTYLALNVLLGGGEGAISPAHIGTALTFSAGSFVYVALDAVHELASSSSDYERGPDGRHVARMTLGRSGRIATLLSGAILPKALQSVLGHGH